MKVYEKVKTAMLAVIRYPWEHGVCAQALYEAGETVAYVNMAREAVHRQQEDGRFATIVDNVAVTDPASCGEAVLRASELTGDIYYKIGALKMLDYIRKKAPRTEGGIVLHNEVSFFEGFSTRQIWVDSCYMLPPFLAIMGEFDEAEKQMDGYIDCLKDPKTGLLYHIYDTEQKRFVRKKLWATGNAWALMGIARLVSEAKATANDRIFEKYTKILRDMLDTMLGFQCENGMFRDILDEPNSFYDGTSAMMTAAVIYRGVYEKWLDEKYLENAEKIYGYIPSTIDEYGLIHGVCGSPDFQSEGHSAEAQAAFVFMEAWRGRGV
ncbi:MAG: glycoside hydrolase family 88 protein [Oscillospiraceae bacterium]|nr:glycoside hydrolase family 88 protein [Oscillospiraceae bacterium]